MTRSVLHVATDWPAHFPNVAATIAALLGAGAIWLEADGLLDLRHTPACSFDGRRPNQRN